jgi:hypothetical protein
MIEKAPRPDVCMTYSDAVLYCQFLTHNGHADWRLPTVYEINEVSGFKWFDDAARHAHFHEDSLYAHDDKFVYPVRTR